MIVFGTMLLALILLVWFIGPRISEQLSALINNLPEYGNNLSKTVASWFASYPEVQKEIKIDAENVSKWDAFST